MDSLKAGVFETLRHPEFFNRMHVLEGLVTWPGELDLDPKRMYDDSH